MIKPLFGKGCFNCKWSKKKYVGYDNIFQLVCFIEPYEIDKSPKDICSHYEYDETKRNIFP